VLDRSRFDLVLLDLWLAPESGLTILPEILRGQPDVSVIAYAFFETAVEAMKVGAVDYLASPPRDGSRPATRQRSGAG